ncbi:MAG: T9SS type A sorting domain-containing protein [Ferruginibacter sp.]
MKKILLSSALLCFLHFSYAQSGLLDPSFGAGGVVKSDLGAPFKINSSARQVLINPAGGFYVILDATFISKRLSNGLIDSSYGFAGYSRSVAIDNASAALQPDGKIVIAGSKVNGSKAFIVARINTNGVPDATFGISGMVTTEFDGSSFAKAVAIQSDGKIVVAGSINDHFGVARYNSNGSPDNDFNGNGQKVTDFSTDLQFANAVAIQADGKIIAGGVVYKNDGVDFGIARYNTDGTPDNTFSGDGMQTTQIGTAVATGNSLAIQGDGKIILAGYASDGGNSNYFAVVRYDVNGNPDNTFNSTGIQTAIVNSDFQQGNSVALQNDGKIVVAGYTLNGASNDFAVARFNTDGSPDNTFDTDGLLITDINSTDDIASSVDIQSDGKILVAGFSLLNSESQFTVTRYNTNGSLDNSFDTDGKLLDDSKQGYTTFNSTAVQADGKIVTAGRTWNGTDYDFAIVRYNLNGTPDNSFSTGGKVTTNFGATDEAVSVAVQSNGKIIVAGNTDDSKVAIARYNADGSPDATFSGDGKLIITIGFADVCKTVALQSDGKIVLAGYSFTDPNYDSVYYAIVRLNADGSFDNTFSEDGKQLTDFEASPSFVSSMVIQNDGKIVAAGRSNINGQNNFTLARYTSDGNLDPTFSQDGKQISAFGGDGYFGQSVAVQNDGKIILAGFSEELFSVTSSFLVARYKANGDLDETFNGQGYHSISLGDHFNFATSVAINIDGRIAVAGTNDNYAIVMYKSDGTRDSTFGLNGVQTTNIGLSGSAIQSIEFSNNRLYAAGSGQFPGTLGVVARYLLTEGGPLPVSLLNFKATLQDKTVLLNWQTVSEQDLAGFTILRSANGSNFLPIGYVNAKGNSNVKVDYSTIDGQPLHGINFYRLRMVDKDGTITFSNIVTVNVNGEVFSLRVFPNPAQDVLFVNAHGKNEQATFQIIDAGGRKIKEIRLSLNDNTNFSIYISNLPKGLYTLQLNTKTKTEIKRFIKE